MKRALLVAVVLAVPLAAQAAPDLAASQVVGPAMGAPGAPVNVAATLGNTGDTAVGGELDYTWFISADRAVTISDTVIVTRRTAVNLMPGQTTMLLESVNLPAGLRAGPHWIGVCANWSVQGFGVAETSFANNCAQEPNPVIITAGPVSITTPLMLPMATQYAPYGLKLEAEGGNGQYDWSLETGSLPLGLQLDRQGDLRGSPTVAGTFTFSVKVTSVSTATAQLTLVVGPGGMGLAVVDQDLPSAEFGRLYDQQLVAAGGKPPYTWALAPNAAPPPGLGVSADGRVTGRPSLAGAFTFAVQVTDDAGATATRSIGVRVTTPVGLHVAITRLATAYLQRDYVQKLTAVGGKAPYTWTVLAFQAQPEDATQVPGPVLSGLPEGFGLVVENGELRGAPKQAGLYALTLRVSDANSAEDYTKLLLKVSYTEPIAITTPSLPDAFVGADYLVKLSHNRQVAGAASTWSLPCVQVPSLVDGFKCQEPAARGKLPAGLTLREDGTLVGNPTEADPGAYAFLVAVVDAEGRRDVRGLSITLRPRIVEETGCSASGLPLPILLWSLFVLAGIRRKRAAP